jgi:hypothetical protein
MGSDADRAGAQLTGGHRRLLLIATVLAPLVAGGCSNASGPTVPRNGVTNRASTNSVPSIAVDDFCNNLADLSSTAQQVGLDNKLPLVRADLARSTAAAQQVLSAGVPRGSDMAPVAASLVSDLQVISDWLDTNATQADLDADRVPTSVRSSVNDMGYEFRQLHQWVLVNCKGQQPGDGQ